MTDIVIRAEGLGKKYVIGHQAERERYVALRDLIGQTAKNLIRTAKDMFHGRPIVAGDSTEEFWALKGINFEIKRGEVVGIIGRNGAGKSTLLKILSRITEPSEGRVTITGRLSSLLEVGTGFHPELTGRENIFLNGAILGMRRDEIKAKFDEIVAFAEIEKFLDTPVKRYSSGMYVRLAFAVAAHLEPEILIVDEVLAVGDAQFQAKCLGKMQDVAKGGERTVLFVSHNMGAVRNLCKSGILLSSGQVIQRGPVEGVVDTYLQQAHTSGDFVPNASSISHLTGCQILHTNGQPATAPFTNEELMVALRYTNLRAIRGLRAGFSISSADGTIISTCCPEDEGAVTPDAEGNHHVIARIPKNVLMKGLHQINAALWHGGEGEIYDEQSAITQFQIEAARERAYTSEYARAGFIQLPVSWQIED